MSYDRTLDQNNEKQVWQNPEIRDVLFYLREEYQVITCLSV